MRNKPRIRFKGFTEDWEQRKLGDFYTFKNGLNKEKVYFGYGDSIVNFTDVFHNRQIYSSTLKGKVLVNKKELENFRVKEGDLFFTRTSETIDEIGFPAVVMEPMERVVFSGFVLRGRAEKNDPLVNIFKSYIFFTDNFRSEMKKKSSMTTRALTSGTALKEMYFSYPKDLEEQTKIGEILLRLDNIITLHQRKLEKLKLAKKALLQKLFPKNGSQFPEIRFKGFTDAWEQRKLGQFTARVTRKNGGQSDLPLTISAQDGLVDQRKYFNRQVASRDMSNYYLIKKGEFAYNKSYSEGYPFGAVKRLDYYNIGALSTLYILFEITDKNISSDFIVSYYMTHLWYKEISKRAAEGARNHGLLNISTEDFFDSELNIPNSIEEQVKIGNFIKEFDKFITLHQCKLDKLQDVKKGLLQKMFV